MTLAELLSIDRHEAVKELAKRPDREGLVNELRELSFGGDRDESLRVQALLLLAELSGEDILPQVLALVHSPQASCRMISAGLRGAEAILLREGSDACERFDLDFYKEPRCLGDSDTLLAWCRYLVALDTPRALHLIAQAAKRDDSLAVRIVDVVSWSRCQQAVFVLADLAATGPRSGRESAERALRDRKKAGLRKQVDALVAQHEAVGLDILKALAEHHQYREILKLLRQRLLSKEQKVWLGLTLPADGASKGERRILLDIRKLLG